MVPSGPLKTSAPKVSFVTQRYLVHIPQQKPLIQGGDTAWETIPRRRGWRRRAARTCNFIRDMQNSLTYRSIGLSPTSPCPGDGDEDRIHHKTAARRQNQNREDEEP
jgi:hypothetical protein